MPGFATLSAPLDVLRHAVKFTLHDDQVAAYRSLVDMLQQAPILALPDFSRPFGLATDASSTGLGACLIQPPMSQSSWGPLPDQFS